MSLQPVVNARAHQVQFCIGNATWQEAEIFTSPRGITVTNLTPGTVYTVRAVGGSTQYSDWSLTMSLMAT